EKGLAKLGIATIYKYKGKTNERQGISFKIGKDCFKGSKIDRKFSLGNLEKYFSFQQQQSQNFTAHPIRPNNHSALHSSESDFTNAVKLANNIEGLIEDFFNARFEPAYGGGENIEPRKKKKKKKRKGLSR